MWLQPCSLRGRCKTASGAVAACGTFVSGDMITSGVAQWLACWAHNPKVRGSKPRSAMPMFPWPGGRAPGLQAQGRRFESQWRRRRPRKKQPKPQNTHSTPPKSTESGQRAPKATQRHPEVYNWIFWTVLSTGKWVRGKGFLHQLSYTFGFSQIRSFHSSAG